MTSCVRIFAGEEAAKAATAGLEKKGLTDFVVLVASTVAGREDSATATAVDDGYLPSGHRAACLESLKQGKSIVAVNAPFGRALEATNIMEAAGAIDTHKLPEYARSDPSPISDMMGIPTLSEFSASTSLADSSWTMSSKFGLGLLSDKAAPLSSMFGLGTLSKPKGSWTKSFGFSMLSSNPAPFSSMFGMKTLKSTPRPWNWSFGSFPLLSDNPAPLSSLMGMPTLTKDR